MSRFPCTGNKIWYAQSHVAHPYQRKRPHHDRQGSSAFRTESQVAKNDGNLLPLTRSSSSLSSSSSPPTVPDAIVSSPVSIPPPLPPLPSTGPPVPEGEDKESEEIKRVYPDLPEGYEGIRHLSPEEQTVVNTAGLTSFGYRFITTKQINVRFPHGTFTIPIGFLSDGFSSPFNIGEQAMVESPLEWLAHDYLFATHTTNIGRITLQQANDTFKSHIVRAVLNNYPYIEKLLKQANKSFVPNWVIRQLLEQHIYDQVEASWTGSFTRGVHCLKRKPDNSGYTIERTDWTKQPEVTTQIWPA